MYSSKGRIAEFSVDRQRKTKPRECEALSREDLHFRCISSSGSELVDSLEVEEINIFIRAGVGEEVASEEV